MSNQEFLQKYIELQSDIMFDETSELGFAKLAYSKTDSSCWWNLAFVNKTLSDAEIRQIEDAFKKINRQPTIYFEDCQELESFKKLLQSKGYAKSAEDCWEFYDSKTVIDTAKFDTIKTIDSEAGLEIFIDTFNNCYKKDDPKNPYGELGDYLDTAKSAWQKHHESGRIQYFMAYKNDKPVGVSSLTNYGGIGYISNVGSLLTVRGEGFGKAVSLYAVRQSIKNGNTLHCLATEAGHYPYEFYKRIGFAPKFSAIALTKN